MTTGSTSATGEPCWWLLAAYDSAVVVSYDDRGELSRIPLAVARVELAGSLVPIHGLVGLVADAGRVAHDSPSPAERSLTRRRLGRNGSTAVARR